MFDNLYEDEIALIIDQTINSFKFVNFSSFKITKELLNSTCHVLVQKANKGTDQTKQMSKVLIF